MSPEIQTAAEALEGDALPRARVVHCDQSAKTAEQSPLPPELANKPVTEKSPAEWAYQRLILYIQNFEQALDGDHELGMGFVGGASGVMRIEGMGFFDPDVVTFYGSDELGAKTQLIQHVSQLNVTLRAVPRFHPEEKEALRIGFRLAAALDESTDETT